LVVLDLEALEEPRKHVGVLFRVFVHVGPEDDAVHVVVPEADFGRETARGEVLLQIRRVRPGAAVELMALRWVCSGCELRAARAWECSNVPRPDPLLPSPQVLEEGVPICGGCAGEGTLGSELGLPIEENAKWGWMLGDERPHGRILGRANCPGSVAVF
jgi:hypothetical protein